MLASAGLRPVLNGQHSKHFSLEAWHTLGREEYRGLTWTTLNREGPMSYIFAILAVPFLSATGIYDPPVMRHGRCIAEPGSFEALYCPAPQAPAHRRYRKR